ncbi:MAG: serine/threonine-protein kinase PknK, partial [Proteobacteria bacterium]|nr:serine/threonine-protein kinase PknK [Pseudomonadota bacterium]
MSVTLGPYRLLSELGRGGMGVVWLAEHPTYGRVAVKLMTAKGLRTPGAKAAFRNEARAMAGMDHPNIARVLDTGVVPEGQAALPAGAPYLVQTLAEGGTLEQHAPYTWPQLRGVLREILAALAHAHARGVVHLDLKPANVLLDGAGHALLADFGIAHAMGDVTLALAGGTPQYMAPEQFEERARDLGPWTDLYSLGCMTWRLVTRQVMWPTLKGPALAYAHHARTPPEFAPAFDVPPGFEGWLRRLLVSAPRERWAFAADALHGLNHLQQAAPEHVMERCQAVMPPSHRPRKASKPVPALDRGALSLFGMRRMRLVGRDAERDRLWQSLGEVTQSQRAQAVVLKGPVGCGKSRLAEWFVARAHEMGAAACSTVRLGEGSSHGLGDLVTELTQSHGLARSETRMRIAEVLGMVEVDRVVALTDCIHLQPDTTDAGSKLSARLAATAWLLGERSGDRPLVVWLDDVANASELGSLLRASLRHEGPLPVLFVCTVDEGTGEGFLDALQGTDGFGVIELPALSDQEHAAVVHQLIRLERGLGRELCRRTQGSPMFAVEFVRDLVQRRVLQHGPRGFELAEGARLELPDDLYAVWDSRVSELVDGLPREASLALAIAAALGPRISVSQWHEACRMVALGAPWLIEEALASNRLIALEAGAVPAWRFVHGGLHGVVIRWAKSHGFWADANKACAAMLETVDESGSEEQRARHLAEAGEHGRAAPLLLRAAVLRYARGDREPLHTLVALREASLRGLGLPEDDPGWGEGWLLRARVYAGDGRLEEADAMLDKIDAYEGRAGWEWLSGRS